MTVQIPPTIVDAYAHLGAWAAIVALDMGLINKTYLLEAGKEKYIIQEVSPIFDVAIHDDALAVSRHLAQRGVRAPMIIPTAAGELYARVDDRVFRALTYIEGRCFHKIQSIKMAKQAGEVVGRFHRTVMDLEHRYHSKRRHGGDYLFHAENLKSALDRHPSHDYFPKVEMLARRMISTMRELTHNFTTTSRHAHGDPKISNILFNEHDEGICLIDFDTLGKSGWSLEMGDALRSWCNPNQEDELSAFVDLPIAEASLQGYGQEMRGMLDAKELTELTVHVQAITLCLAMRYLTDVLNESYWAFDRSRFERPAAHNWLRAQAMYELFQDFVRKSPELRQLVNGHLL